MSERKCQMCGEMFAPSTPFNTVCEKCRIGRYAIGYRVANTLTVSGKQVRWLAVILVAIPVAYFASRNGNDLSALLSRLAQNWSNTDTLISLWIIAVGIFIWYWFYLLSLILLEGAGQLLLAVLDLAVHNTPQPPEAEGGSPSGKP